MAKKNCLLTFCLFTMILGLTKSQDYNYSDYTYNNNYNYDTYSEEAAVPEEILTSSGASLSTTASTSTSKPSTVVLFMTMPSTSTSKPSTTATSLISSSTSKYQTSTSTAYPKVTALLSSFSSVMPTKTISNIKQNGSFSTVKSTKRNANVFRPGITGKDNGKQNGKTALNPKSKKNNKKKIENAKKKVQNNKKQRVKMNNQKKAAMTTKKSSHMNNNNNKHE